jgi:glycosyltransferase involved in cell wall biosynthesis
MNILILVDKEGSAIDRLCQSIKKFNPHFNIKIQAFHPKRPDLDQLENTPKLWDWADLVHVCYWRSGAKFAELHPQKFNEKRKILSHHNPYDLEEEKWLDIYKRVIVSNEDMHAKIPYANLVPQGMDLGYWEYNPGEYTKEKVVNMVVARIEGKKGVEPVAKVCKELGYKFVLVGRISKMDYFKQIMAANPDTIFKENISDDELRQVYYDSAIHVCNSISGFESGTMPILESMACGVPVLTRSVGHVPDLFNGENMVIRGGDPEDTEDLKKELKDLMENRPLREKIREKAWWTVKDRPAQKMARRLSKLYYEVLGEKEPLVSVIVPTYDRPEVLLNCIARIVNQKYLNKEIIVADSGKESVELLINKVREQVSVPIKYIRFSNPGHYTLPEARNRAVIESEGVYLMFCDERIGIEPGAIGAFVNNAQDKTWLFGFKDEVEKGFVENFSFIAREELIRCGMFNERIDWYGGASQDLRTRFGANGFYFQVIPEAKAVSLIGSKNKSRKKKQIIKSKYTLWKMYGKE